MARYDLNDPRDYMQINDFITLASQNGWEVECKKYSPPRSGKQNRYLWLLIGYFATQYGCTLIESEEAHFKEAANFNLFHCEYINKNGRMTSYMRHTYDLSKDEMSQAIRNFKAYAGMNGIPLPDAEDYVAIKFCEREIEKNQNYI